MFKIITGVLLFIVPLHLIAQTLPKEGARLNYRIIGFSFPKGQQTSSKYKIEIAAGNYYDDEAFKNNIVKSYTSDKNKMIGEVPSFGKQYTWRSAIINNTKTVTSELHHFSTMTSKRVDTTITRLRILKPAETYKDAYVLMDGAKAIYDMNGNPVWFLPSIDGAPADQFSLTGDIQLTKQGTITFMTNRQGGQVYEVNYNGSVLWKGPNTGQVSGDTVENYNHEFTRLSNGHYMVMGEEHVLWKLPHAVDSSFFKHPGNQGKIIWDSTANIFYEKMEFGTIIEYDQKGNLVWSWKSSNYYKGADIFSRVSPDGTFYIKDVHANAFYFDEKKKTIYVSFKNASRILKVQYPAGNILNVYGKKYDNGDIHGYGPDLFAYQHSCRISQDGYLYLFNNNSRHKEDLPTLLIMQENGSDTLKKVWEYQCTIEGLDTSLKESAEFTSLGSVFELPDRSILACMSSYGYTKAFIVSRDRNVLWSAMPELWNPAEKKWHPIIQYRTSIIVDHKDLEQLIWNTEKQPKQ